MNATVALNSEPLSRNKDPWTSFMAAEQHARSGHWHSQKAAVLAALKSHPYVTSAELTQIMGLSDRYVCSRRLADLVNEGKAERRRPRRCKVTHRVCMTWYAKREHLDLFGHPLKEGG